MPDDLIARHGEYFARDPRYVDALVNRGKRFAKAHRHAEAVAAFAEAARLDPGHKYLMGRLLHAKMHCCDWSSFDDDVDRITTALRAGKQACVPFAFQAISDSPEDLQQCSRIYAADKYPPANAMGLNRTRSNRHKIRLGYVCGEFGQTSQGHLSTELFERHDKVQFELYGFDSGKNDQSSLRKRIDSAFDCMIDISGESDAAAAQIVCDAEIDILLNRNGYSGRERMGVFAFRPSPIQVNFLGFPGTLGASYIDYIIADRWVIPEGNRKYYDEKVVYLPDTYQSNMSMRQAKALPPGKAEAGLPENAFVFCCFNNSYKITPEVFDVWMGLLRSVPGSVFWLLEANSAVSANLRAEAKRRGIPGERLIFAPRRPIDEHLARHELADLFLDTMPCNAHTTASDALRAGLPIVACLGNAFAARVAASLLHAIGLPELVTDNLADYASLALRLAQEPVRLRAIRTRLEQQRKSHALFDADRYRQSLERAYIEMWRRHSQGLATASFSI